MNQLLFSRSTGNLSPEAFARIQTAQSYHAIQPCPRLQFHGGERQPEQEDEVSKDHSSTVQPKIWAHQAGVNAMSLDIESRVLVSGGADSSIKLWDLEEHTAGSKHTFRPVGEVARTATAHKFGITQLNFYPFDSAAFLSSSYDHHLKLYSTETLEVSADFDLGSIVYTHALSPIATHLLVACATQHPAVRLVDLRSGSSTHSLAGHHGALLSLAWSPATEHILASGGIDGTIRLWDIRKSSGSLGVLDMEDSLGVTGTDGMGRSSRDRSVGKAHAAAVNGISWTTDGSYTISTGHDQRIRVWDAATGANTLANFGPSIKNGHLSCLPLLSSGVGRTAPGKELLFYPNEKEILVFELHEGKLLKRLKVPGPNMAAVRSRTGERNVKNRITGLVWKGQADGLYSAHTDGQIRGELLDPKYGCTGQQRWYARSNSEKAKPDADSIATEMIKYAASCRNQESTHGEAIRVLEQGRGFLLNEGPSAASATGRVLLTLATFYADRARLADAVEALQVASDLESASLEVRVAALEALAGLCLRLQQEEPALRYAHSCGQLVMAASDTVPEDELAEFKFRSKAVTALAALVCARCGAADSKLFEDVPTWLGENSRRTAGVSAAVFSIAQCAHVGGSLKIAGELYEKAIAIIRNSKEGNEVTLASVAMAPDEVHIGALAGLGQLAAYKGDFDEAGKKITEALTLAEKINGDRHPRVGVILACLADVYSRIGKTKGSGDSFIISEGLYRKCQEYLGSPPVEVPDTGKALDLVDIMTLSRARYAEIVSKFPNRDLEAEKLRKWASTMWKGPRPLADLVKIDDVVKPSDGNVEGHVVIDVRLGRVIWKV